MTDETNAEEPEVGPTAHLSLLSDRPVIAVLAVGFVLMFGYEAVAPALPSVADALGITDSEVALVMTAFAVPAVAFFPVTGVLADFYGRRAVLVPSLLVFGATGTAMAFVTTLGPLLILRGVQGLAFAGILPISVTILGDLYSGPEGSAAQGLRTSATGVATLVVPLVAGYLAGLAWNYPFLLHVLVFPVVVLAYFLLPDWEGEVETTAGLIETLQRYVRALRTEVSDRQVAVLLSGGLVRGFSRIGLVTFAPLFAVRSLGATALAAGAVLSARGVARIIVPPLAGAATARLTWKWAIIAGIGISSVSAALIPTAGAPLQLGLLLGLYTVGDALFSPVSKEAVTTRATDERRAGVVNSMYVLQNGGEALAPVVFGFVLAAAGFDALFLVAAAVLGGYAIVAARYL